MPSPIPPPGSHFISLEKFQQMKELYAKNSQAILQPPYQNKEILITSETFNGDVLTAIQNVTDFAGLRIYYGMSDDLKIHAMLIAVDKGGNDLLPSSDATFATGGEVLDGPGVVLEEGQRCPPTC